MVVDALYDSLTRWDADLAVQPATAARWESRRRGRRWRFFLRPGAVFHDGTPVTAASFVAAWTDLARGGAAHHHLRDVVGYRDLRRGDQGPLRGLRALDDGTLEVRLTAPNAEFPAVAGHPALGPAPASARDDPDFGDRPVGNGPFRMAEPWAHGRFVRLTRVAAGVETGTGTPLDEVIFRIQDAEGGYIAYEQGRVDVATVPAGALQARHEQGRERTAVYAGPGLLRGRLAATYFLLFDTGRAPFDSRAVRRAISQALDRRAIVNQAFEGNAGLGLSVVPPMLPGARQRTCLECVHDPAAARRALRQARLDEIDLWISEGGEHERVARQVAADLGAVGVRVRIRAVAPQEYVAALRRGRPGLYRFGWSVDYPTLDNALRPLFHSQAAPESGGANFSRYADAQVDALLDRARSTADSARRLALQRRAEDIIVGRDQAIIPVVNPRRRTLVAQRVRGLAFGPLGTADLGRVRVVDRGTGTGP